MEALVTAAAVLLTICAAQDTRQIHGPQAPQHTTPASSATDPVTSWLSSTSSSKPNVLFLVIDDLRPRLGCYGDRNMVTPNIDQLASKSLRFDRAYAQQALCGPSRASFLTSRRPDTTRVLDLETYFRNVAANFTTLPQHFKGHGYHTVSIGKIFHPGPASGNTDDFPYSWSTKAYRGVEPMSWDERHLSTIQPVSESVVGKLQDTTLADRAVEWLHNYSKNTDNTQQQPQPFFLAVGFHKPHLPWVFPQEYLDLYPLSNIHLARHRTRPPSLPDVAWYESSELRGFGDIIALNLTFPYDVINDDYQLKLRQAYYASTSYMDSKVGRVLSTLHDSGFTNNTIIVFFGDHGYQLGENAEWNKHTNFEVALRIPMMLYVPGVTSTNHSFPYIDTLHSQPAGDSAGSAQVTKELVEAVDLFPTLSELAGLPVPAACPRSSLLVPTCTEGTSFVPLVRAHVQGSPHVAWKDAVFSQYPRFNDSSRPVMGYTVRTQTHRYTEWVSYDPARFEPNFDRMWGRELYDERTDPEEFTNLAETTTYADTVTELSRVLRAGWKAAMDKHVQLVG